MKKRLNIVLLGPPGSGKGVQSELLKRHFKLRLVAMGELLRLEVKRNTAVGKSIKNILGNKGSLVPSEVAIRIAKKHIGRIRHGLLFDGFPREVREAKMLDKMIDVTHVFVINVPRKTIIKRLSSRYECYCGMTYNLLSKKPKHDLRCDKCGRKLYKRDDDKPSLITKRLKIYKKETLPVVRHYKEKDITKVIEINGMNSIKKVFNHIKKRIR